MVNTAFALEFTTPCKLVCKCGIYHLCISFPPRFLDSTLVEVFAYDKDVETKVFFFFFTAKQFSKLHSVVGHYPR